MIKIRSEFFWLWVTIELENKRILAQSISKEGDMFVVTERFLSSMVKEYNEHPVSTDDDDTWYPQACQFLKLNYHLHSTYGNDLIERRTIYSISRIEQNHLITIIFLAKKKTTL